MTDYKERLFQGYLLLNWKTGEMKLVKRDPSASDTPTGYWVPVKLNLSLQVPYDDVELNAQITLSTYKVGEIMLKELTHDDPG